MHVYIVKIEAFQNIFNVKNTGGTESIAENRLGRFGARKNRERTSFESTNLYCKKKRLNLQSYGSGFYGFRCLKYKHFFTLWVFTVQISIFIKKKKTGTPDLYGSGDSYTFLVFF